MWLFLGSSILVLGVWTLFVDRMGATAVFMLVVSALAFRAAAKSPRADDSQSRQAPMIIVPWGVVVDPERDTRVLHWAAVRDVSVQEKHVLRGGTPRVISSHVTVRTERERLRGNIGGPAGLEGLSANLRRYADEAGRPIAGDLDGRTSVDDSGSEPVVEQLISRARALCSTGEGATRLRLPAGGYRDAGLTTAGPETAEALRGVLFSGTCSSSCVLAADPRPLAALVAAQLGATGLVPDLLRLMSSPHPVVAAVAKACALRLGATPNRAGTLDEVAQFLRDDDLVALRELAARPDSVPQAA